MTKANKEIIWKLTREEQEQNCYNCILLSKLVLSNTSNRVGLFGGLMFGWYWHKEVLFKRFEKWNYRLYGYNIKKVDTNTLMGTVRLYVHRSLRH